MSQTEPHGDHAVVFVERITPKEGRAQDCLDISLRSADLLRGQGGLLQSIVMRPQKSGQAICSMSVWESKGHFAAFMKSEAFTALVASDDLKNIKLWMQDYDGQMMDLVDGWHP